MHKASDINQPSGIWVLIDERPATINNWMFEVHMELAKGATGRIIEHPSNEHPGAGIGFADGHVELKQWRTSQMRSGGDFIPAPFNEDLAWLADRTTTRIE
jgi:prepilin-type processing-associated H-X9-DG protein